MKLGFTGTRDGMTDHQKLDLSFILKTWGVEGIHHGDCVGADAEAHDMAKSMSLYVVIHPPIDPKLRAWCVGADEMRDELPYIERNHAIVDETNFLFVAPRTEEETIRSGTWATKRYAESLGYLERIWIAEP